MKAERAIISLATGKNPKAIFRHYMDVVSKMLANGSYNILSDKNLFMDGFCEETYTNFAALIKYDVEQIKAARNQAAES